MTYELENGMVVREDGWIAIQHRTSNGANLKVGEDIYVFVPKMNVSLAWVRPEHATKILNELARICCNQQGRKFFLASLTNVNLWETGQR